MTFLIRDIFNLTQERFNLLLFLLLYSFDYVVKFRLEGIKLNCKEKLPRLIQKEKCNFEVTHLVIYQALSGKGLLPGNGVLVARFHNHSSLCVRTFPHSKVNFILKKL